MSLQCIDSLEPELRHASFVEFGASSCNVVKMSRYVGFKPYRITVRPRANLLLALVKQVKLSLNEFVRHKHLLMFSWKNRLLRKYTAVSAFHKE